MREVIVMPLLFFMLSASSQNLTDAKQLLYYQKYKAAATVLHNILKNDPTNGEAWYLLTEVSLKQEKKSIISDSLNLTPDHTKDDPFYLVALGHLCLSQKEKEKAENYFAQALEKTKYKKPEVLLAIAKSKIESKNGDPNQAIELLQQAIKKDKNNPAIYTELGKAYMKLVNGGEAFRAFEEANQKDNHYAEAYYRLGIIFKTQKNAELYLKYFNQAIEADHNFAPAYYELYNHYYFHDVAKAKEYLEKYMMLAEPSVKTEYEYTDLLYLTKAYDPAIEHANRIIAKEKNKAPARLYKLIAYSYKGKNLQQQAFDYMTKYFAVATDTSLVPKDFSTFADLYLANEKIDSAIKYYSNAVSLEKDTSELLNYYKTLVDLNKKQKNYPEESYWLEKYYQTKTRPSNVDLFNWGIACYLSKDYKKSDSVFASYAEKYPEQDFGFYWQARSDVAIDTTMEEGLAVPHYLKVIEIDQGDTTGKTKSHLIEAYGYLGAYEANAHKNYEDAIEYFEKLLAIDPENVNAKKSIDQLKKFIAKKEGATGS